MRQRLHGTELPVTVLVALLLASCSGTPSSGSAPTSVVHVSTPSPESATGTTTADSYVRRCGTEVRGSLGPPSRWQPSSVVLDPFAFVWIRQFADFRPGSRPGDAPPVIKVMGLVKAGHQVVVTLPTNERSFASLLYEPGSPFTLRGGVDTVTFDACPGTSTSWRGASQFNGGIYVSKPTCLALSVSIDGAPPMTVEAPVGVGTGTCG